MLSRITRMSSLGAHLVSGCSLLREPTAPKPFAKAETPGLSGSLIVSKERSPGSSPDPFLWHEHDNFLAELSELDLWKSEFAPTTARTEPEHQSTSLCDSAEWSSILSNMEWIDKFEALDIPGFDSELSSDYPESTSQDSGIDFIEKTASLIDWKAWNCYLGADEDLNLDMKCNGNPAVEEESLDKEVAQAALGDVKAKNDDSQGPVEFKKEDFIDNKLNEIERAIVRSSGPLTWLPSDSGRSSCTESLCESNPSSEETTDHVRTFKRRGVKMKPPSDDETNHRRWLNREAAFRYRERKRMEQLERKRELEYLLNRNNFLKQQVRQLSREIVSWQQKLDTSIT